MSFLDIPERELSCTNIIYNPQGREVIGDYESNITRYEIILADLATIKRAIKNNQSSVKIFGTDDCRGYIYTETLNVLKKAGLDYDGDGFSGEIWLLSIEEFEEEWLNELQSLG